MHGHGRHAQVFGHGLLAFGTDPALLLLHDGQTRHHGRLLLLGGVLGDLAGKTRQRSI